MIQTLNSNPAAILGGGQLAQMLVQAAQSLGLDARPLVANAEEPAAQVAKRFVIGKLSESAAVQKLLEQCRLAIFENEFVDTSALQLAAQGLSLQFAPSLEVIHRLQDKLRQKEFLRHLSISAPEFEIMPVTARGNETHELAWAAQMLERWPNGVVLKWAQLGYDGYGTWISNAKRDFSAKEVSAFLARARKKGVAVFAEEKINFVREVAIVACRSSTGEFGAYPLVISRQEGGVCREVMGPAIRMGVKEQHEADARESARRIADELDLVGTFAIEFFETQAGPLRVNELAPRVHNTGHYTLDAGMTSQFENHWRAVLGLPLGPMTPRAFFAMRNLLGPRSEGAEPADRPASPPTTFLDDPLRLHWYGKREMRPGRKMGHLNTEAQTLEELSVLRTRMAEVEARWIEENTDGRPNP